MEYQKAYKIAHEISKFFVLDFDGKQKAQMAQIILNNVNEEKVARVCPNCDREWQFHDPRVCSVQPPKI